MTKEEKIQDAYGEHWVIAIELCNENGWIKNFEYYTYFPKLKEQLAINGYECKRPLSLKGIENNNGWIKIESESDLPKEQTSNFVVLNNGGITQSFYYGQISDYMNKITHYQPIENPKPPIY